MHQMPDTTRTPKAKAITVTMTTVGMPKPGSTTVRGDVVLEWHVEQGTLAGGGAEKETE